MIAKIPASWQKHLDDEREKPYFVELEKFVADEQATQTIYPLPEKIFTALNLTWGYPPKHPECINNGVLQSIICETAQNLCLFLCLIRCFLDHLEAFET